MNTDHLTATEVNALEPRRYLSLNAVNELSSAGLDFIQWAYNMGIITLGQVEEAFTFPVPVENKISGSEGG